MNCQKKEIVSTITTLRDILPEISNEIRQETDKERIKKLEEAYETTFIALQAYEDIFEKSEGVKL